MREYFTNPVGPRLRQPVEHAPKRTVYGYRITRIIKRSVVDQAKKKIEKFAAVFQISPLKYVLDSQLPFAAFTDVGLQ